MITYVNTVFVSNSNTTALATSLDSVADGQFVILDVQTGNVITSITNSIKEIKIGMGTGKTSKDHKGVSHPEIRWSNIIKRHDVKSIAVLDASDAQNSEDTVTIDFTSMDNNVTTLLANGGKRVIVRLTFKDLPTRFRKWTESYEYVTVAGDTKATIASGIASLINKQWKRARVVADGTTTSGKLVLTAMPYDDDDSVNSINLAEKVRFNVNIYYTDPAAEGWESLNKHYPTGVTIAKTPGFRYPGEGKLVRDRESQAMGYLGILNRGEGTWPIIQPAMRTDITKNYNVVTLEFENMYRAADDIFRKTKQTVEIYMQAEGAIIAALQSFAANNATVNDTQTEDGLADE